MTKHTRSNISASVSRVTVADIREIASTNHVSVGQVLDAAVALLIQRPPSEWPRSGYSLTEEVLVAVRAQGHRSVTRWLNLHKIPPGQYYETISRLEAGVHQDPAPGTERHRILTLVSDLLGRRLIPH